MSDKIRPQHLQWKAMFYVRQSSAFQVTHNLESQKLQYAMQERIRQLGWKQIEVMDDDLGRSAAGTVARAGFGRMVAEVCMGKVGAVAARRFRASRGTVGSGSNWFEVCRVVDTVLIDHDAVYSP
jgi:DNA invertase Pin-like site-specific DNA recombinase